MRELVIGRGAVPWGAASELLDALGAPDELRRLHRPAFALLAPELPMTTAQRERNARMRLLNDLPNVQLTHPPLEEAFAAILDEVGSDPITLSASELGWDDESARLFAGRAWITVRAAGSLSCTGGELEAERAFDAHAFSISAPCAERWSHDGALRAHYVAGLSAHHQDPFDAELSARAARHLAHVAAGTERSAERAHACYRLAVHAVRHAGAPADGLREADAAIEASSGIESLREAYEAWARNARAFALARLDRTSEARDELEQALDALARVTALAPLDRYVEDSVHTVTMNLRRIAP